MWIWITMLWMVLGSSTVDAQDLLSSKVDPRMLLNGFEPSIQDAAKVEETLLRYAKGSKYVVIGEVIHVDRNLRPVGVFGMNGWSIYESVDHTSRIIRESHQSH